MKRRHVSWILPALLSGVLLISACGDTRDDRVSAQPLTLATPVSAPSQGGGVTVPQEIVVVLVTATPAEGGGGQQEQDQQQQGNGQAGGGQAGDQELISMGEQIYSSECASCHQPNGEGTSTYPALAGSAVLTGEDPSSAIQTVVNGRGEMPAFGNSLSTEEIAAVISYERNSWGNEAGVVTADEVSQVQNGGDAQSDDEQEQEGEASQEDEAAGDDGGDQAQQPPSGEDDQASATQEQASDAITVRIEIVVMTPEAGAEDSQPATEEAEATPTPTPEDENGDEADGDAQAENSADQQEQQEGNDQPEDEEAAGDQELISMGEEIYSSNCASCHQPEGEGTSEYPSLADSEMLTGEDAASVIELVVNGRGEMPAFGDSLSAEEIAAVISYERNSWGNEAGVVTVDEVGQVQDGGNSQSGDEQSNGEQSNGGAASEETEATPEPEAEQPQEAPTPEDAQAQATPAAEDDSASTSDEETPAMGDTGEAESGDQEILQIGEHIYGTTCANCHQLSGEGNTAYPSLVNNEMVTAEDPTAALLTILNGRGHMPSFGGMLSDQEIAAVLSHERNAWENNASIVTVDQVMQARESEEQTGDAGAEGDASQEGTGQEQSTEEESSQAEATPTPEAEGSEGEQAQGTDPVITVEAGGTDNASDGVIPIEIYIIVATPASSGEEQASSSEEPTATPTPEEAETADGASEESEEPSTDASSDAQGAVVRPGVPGMWHFGQFLEIPEVAAVISYLHSAWNHSAPALTHSQVQ